MSNLANADHTPATLKRYALKLYDTATRTFRANPYEGADACVRNAMGCLRWASGLVAGGPRNDRVYTANELNATVRSMNRLLAQLGKPEFSFVDKKET